MERCEDRAGTRLPSGRVPGPGGLSGLLLPGAIGLLWWGASRLGLWTPYLLPSPEQVFSSLGSLTASGELARHVGASAGRIAAGFGLSSLVALPLGVLLGLRPRLGRLAYSTLEFLRHVPPLAVLPLLILWFGIGEGSKMAVILLATFFPVFLNTLEGVRRCDPGLLEVGRTLGLSEGEGVRRIVLPSALPSILTGLRLGLGYSWRSLIGAELIAAASGLGYLIHDAEALSRPDVIVAGVLVLGVIGAATDHLFFRLAARVTPWRPRGDARDGWD